MIFRIASALAVLVLFAGCVTETTNTQVMPGSDRDAHGCIPSAGYAWCSKTGACERPFELAAAKGFENTAAAFDNYCKN